jgi:hypothetical protein
MNPPEPHDPLDPLLRDHNQYIHDHGFTNRVMAALPRRRPRACLRRTMLLGATALGYLLAIAWLPIEWFNPAILVSMNVQALVQFTLALAILGSVTWGIVSAFATE